MDAPVYYEASSKLTDEQVDWVLHALSITPILCSIYVSPHDSELASKISDNNLRTMNLEAARDLAKYFHDNSGGRPSLVLGEAGLLDAVYPDGKRECLKN